MPRWAVIGAWLLLALAMIPLQGPLQSRAADESDTFLARGSESAEAKRVIDENFRAGSESAAIVAYFRDGGISSDRPRAHQRGHAADLRRGDDPQPQAGRLGLRAGLRRRRIRST